VIGEVPLGVDVDGNASFHLDGCCSTVAFFEDQTRCAFSHLDEMLRIFVIGFSLALLGEGAILPGVSSDEDFLVDI